MRSILSFAVVCLFPPAARFRHTDELPIFLSSRTWPIGPRFAMEGHRTMARLWPRIAMLVAILGIAGPAGAADDRISLGEVSVTQPAPGLDAATLKTAAQGELENVDTTHMKRRVIVSVAVTGASDAPVACTVNTVVRDKKSGTIIAIIEGRASTDARGDAEVRKAVLRAAVRTAVRQIPDALSGS
jgi:hypothetical protein